MAVCGVGLFALSVGARADTLTINATGTIVGACQLSVGSNFPTNADLSVSGSSSATALVDCSTPFKINATSSKGALTTSAAAVSGFTNSLTYTLAMSVPLNAGGPATASCASNTLASGQSSCALSPGNTTGLYSGASGTATNKTATLTASWTTPSSPRLVAGAYADTLTVTIAAVP